MNPQESLDRILRAFESGELPGAVARTFIQSTGDIPCEDWSLMNRLILCLNGTSDARGFKQWRKVGRYVRKGSKAIAILAPIFKTFAKEDKETGEKAKFQKLVGFKGIPVFAFEDTAGEELPESQRAAPSPEAMPPLLDVAAEFGLSVSWEACRGDYYGYYSNDRKKIVLCTHDQDVFFHELGHAAHYRSKGEHAKATAGQDWRKETVAELIAATISAFYGLETSGNAYKYISRYAEKAKKNVMQACMAVLADTQKALACIFETKAQLAKAA